MSGGRVDLKVVLLGKEYSGKTSLVERYLYNRFLGSVPYQNVINLFDKFIIMIYYFNIWCINEN